MNQEEAFVNRRYATDDCCSTATRPWKAGLKSFRRYASNI